MSEYVLFAQTMQAQKMLRDLAGNILQFTQQLMHGISEQSEQQIGGKWDIH
jgi:hypothetical protein